MQDRLLLKLLQCSGDDAVLGRWLINRRDTWWCRGFVHPQEMAFTPLDARMGMAAWLMPGTSLYKHKEMSAVDRGRDLQRTYGEKLAAV